MPSAVGRRPESCNVRGWHVNFSDIRVWTIPGTHPKVPDELVLNILFALQDLLNHSAGSSCMPTALVVASSPPIEPFLACPHFSSARRCACSGAGTALGRWQWERRPRVCTHATRCARRFVALANASAYLAVVAAAVDGDAVAGAAAKA